MKRMSKYCLNNNYITRRTIPSTNLSCVTYIWLCGKICVTWKSRSLPAGVAPIVVSRIRTKTLFSNHLRTYHSEILIQTLTHERIRSCMRVTLRISLCLSGLMFSLLNAHGNVCWNTFEVLIEGPFVSVKTLRIISCEPNNHKCKHKLQHLSDYSKINIWLNTCFNWQMN